MYREDLHDTFCHSFTNWLQISMAAVPAMMIAELIAAAFGTSQKVTIATAAVSAAPTRAETRLNTFLVMVTILC